MLTRRPYLFLFLFVLLLAACNNTPAGPNTPLPPAPTATDAPAPTTVPTTTDEPPAATATTVAPVAAPLPAPTLFDVAWDDRSPFAGGLIPAGQDALETVDAGASVYHLDLALDDSLTALSGREEVRYTNREDVALDEIYFRLFPNVSDGTATVETVTVNGQPVTPGYELQNSAMSVPMMPPLAPGGQVVVAIDFSVQIPTELGGNYGIFAYYDDVLALAHAYPMIAVYDDEGWNVEIAPESGDVVYADTSFFLVRVTTPAGVMLAASGVETGRDESGGRQTITYAAGPMRDFYLAASTDYTVVSAAVGPTTVNSYAVSRFDDGAAEALQYATAALQSFNEQFGTYPFTELDLISTPTLALGIEYPGIIAITHNLYDPEGGYPPVWLESTVTHEVAHQWFYSLVGNDQLDDPWLDESLTQYATMLFFSDQYGESGASGYRQSLINRWNAVEQQAIPIGMPVSDYPGVAYSAIIYGRGPLFFEAMAEEMGQDTFMAFLRDYVATNKWKIATPEELKSLAEEHCACDLTPLFQEWVYSQ